MISLVANTMQKRTREFSGLVSRLLYSILIFTALQTAAWGQTIRGSVLYQGHPVKKALIYVSDSIAFATSDRSGNFEIEGLSAGRYQIVVTHIQFEPWSESVQLSSSKDLILEISLQERVVELEEVTVSEVPLLTSNSINKITEEEVRRYPGTFFDPARFANAFPSVQVANDQTNQLAIGGLPPDLMQWNIEGLEVVNPNHLAGAGTLGDRPSLTGGSVTMLSNQILSNSSLRNATEPGQQGNAVSGIMDIYFRPGNAAQREHTFQIGLLGIEAATEGPFKKGGKSSYLVNYRYSTVGLITALGVDFGDEDIRFQDLSMVLNFPLKKGYLRLFGFGGLNSNDHPPLPVDEWEEDTDFKDIRFRSRAGGAGIIWKTALGERTFFTLRSAISGQKYERYEYWPDDAFPATGDYVEGGADTKLSAVAAISAGVGKAGVLTGSITTVADWMDYFGISLTTTAPGFEALNNNVYVRPHVMYQTSFQDIIKLKAGLGISYYANSSSANWEPEIELTWQINPRHSITASSRWVTKAMNHLFFMTTPAGTPQNESLEPVRALLGETKYNGQIWGGAFEARVFLNDLFRLYATREASDYSPLNLYAYPNTAALQTGGAAYSYGASIAYRKNFSRGWFGSANVTVFETQYKGSDDVERSATFDNNYSAYIGGGKEWTRNRDYGLRSWGVSGSLVTQGGLRGAEIDEVASRTAAYTVYIPGTAGTTQIGSYYRIDTRIYLRKDKKNHSSTWSLDIQNLLNTENEWLPRYDHLLQDIRRVTQLGIIPVLSYRIDF